MAELTLRGIGKVYNKDVRVLSGIDLDIKDGEFWCWLAHLDVENQPFAYDCGP